MGLPFKLYINSPQVYSCSGCRAHLTDHDDLISKVMPSRHTARCLGSWA
jgi:hypothetical protein